MKIVWDYFSLIGIPHIITFIRLVLLRLDQFWREKSSISYGSYFNQVEKFRVFTCHNQNKWLFDLLFLPIILHHQDLLLFYHSYSEFIFLGLKCLCMFFQFIFSQCFYRSRIYKTFTPKCSDFSSVRRLLPFLSLKCLTLDTTQLFSVYIFCIWSRVLSMNALFLPGKCLFIWEFYDTDFQSKKYLKPIQ